MKRKLSATSAKRQYEPYRCYCVACTDGGKTPEGVLFTRTLFYVHRNNRSVRQGEGLSGLLRSVEPDWSHVRDQKLVKLRRVLAVQDRFEHAQKQLQLPGALVFARVPGSPVIGDSWTTEVSSDNADTALMLAPSNLGNAMVLDWEALLLECVGQLARITALEGTVVDIHTQLQHELECAISDLAQFKRSEWNRQAHLNSDLEVARIIRKSFWPHECKSSQLIRRFIEAARRGVVWSSWHPALIVTHVAAAAQYLLGHVSQAHTNLLLKTFPILLQSWSAPGDEIARIETLSDIPRDVRTALDRLELEPVTDEFVCCPVCFSLYPLPSPGADPNAKCTRRESLDPRQPACGRRLYKDAPLRQDTTPIPKRTLLQHSFADWLSRLLNRPGMEELLELDLPVEQPDTMTDIWDGPFLRNFLDKDNKSFFFRTKSYGRELKLAFAICVDGFAPFGSHSNRTVHAVGVYLALLNLPIHLRYQVANMFLSTIGPGPNGPLGSQINPVLRPTMDIFCEAWESGLFIQQTPTRPSGRRVRAAIVPAVCDMVAARQVGGLRSAKFKYFCSFCWTDLDSCCCHDPSRIALREDADWRIDAEAWLHADNQDQRDEIFNTLGLWHSELMRLPYFRPTQQLVPDSMHAFYLRVFPTQTRELMGMSQESRPGDATFDGYAVMPKRSRDRPVSRHELQKGLWLARFATEEVLRAQLVPDRLLMSVRAKLQLPVDRTLATNKVHFRDMVIKAILGFVRVIVVQTCGTLTVVVAPTTNGSMA